MSERRIEVCATCGHEVRYHFQDVTGVVRCILVERGTSTSGVIGLPWSRECSCENYVLRLPACATSKET